MSSLRERLQLAVKDLQEFQTTHADEDSWSEPVIVQAKTLADRVTDLRERVDAADAEFARIQNLMSRARRLSPSEIYSEGR
jgi:hypothetical protein